ncbi:MAG: hypothetical protein OXD45_08620 [Rhodobacteraceae bacterium]|nr:hypothetical protein [Paracoccaceae bacterium]
MDMNAPENTSLDRFCESYLSFAQALLAKTNRRYVSTVTLQIPPADMHNVPLPNEDDDPRDIPHL